MKTELKLKMQIQDNPYYKDNPTYFMQLKNLVESTIKGYAIKLRKYKELLKWINDVTPLLSDSFYKINTKCYWILNGLTDFPICLNDKKKMTYRNVQITVGYPVYCCNHCQITSKEFKEQRIITWKINYGNEIITSPSQAKVVRQKQIATCIKNNGVQFPMQSIEIFEKGRDTKQEKYNDRNYVNPKKALQTRKQKNNGKFESDQSTEKRKQTCLRDYNSMCVLASEYGKQEIIKTSQKKYGTNSPNSAEIVKQNKIAAIQQTYGKDYINVFQLPAVKEIKQVKLQQTLEKIAITKKQNGTFNTSKLEEIAYQLLSSIFDDIIRQYKSAKYPFNCDFYIKSLDLYIECNFHWTHGGHYFDSTNKDDLKIVEKWKAKNTKFYNNAINTWTIRDIKKHVVAIENNLNYLVFWNINDIEIWLSSLKQSK